MKHLVLLILELLFVSCQLSAQDIKGAYIRSSWVPNTITFTPIYEYSYTLTLLTDPLINVSRSTVTVSFGDNTSGTLSLASTTIVSGTTIRTYTGTHLYAGSTPDGAYYAVEYLDGFRVANIKNIPTSQTQSVYARSLIVANQYFWTKPSGTVTNYPPSLGIIGNNFMYDLMFTKGTDIDSVSYSLFNYFNVGGYYIPDGAVLSPTSGILTFPRDSIGLYTFNVKIIEWGKDPTGLRRQSRTTYVDFVIDINTTVGLNEGESRKSSLNLYPNPTSNYLFIDNLKTENQILNYKIYGSASQKLIEGNLISTNQHSIDVSNLPQGTYFIIFSDGTQTFENKFVLFQD